MKGRGRWQGALSIARFNWPYYAAATVILVLALFALATAVEGWIEVLSWLALAGAGFFVFGSLGVSHLIYDRSDLYRWQWLERALIGAQREHFILCHAGFDETSAALRERFPSTCWQILDHFDAALMPERSIHRARQLYPPTPDTVRAPFDRWPVDSASADVVFGLLAIHEFRTEEQRTAWLREAKRALRPTGRVILVEHVRDLANFVAFGPGFLHFHSPASWHRCWKAAGWRVADQFRLTPWVRVFVLLS